MVLEEVPKSKFAHINDKRYFFSGIALFPFSHPYLEEIIDYKKKRNEKIEKYIQSKKNNLIKLKKSYFKK